MKIDKKFKLPAGTAELLIQQTDDESPASVIVMVAGVVCHRLYFISGFQEVLLKSGIQTKLTVSISDQ